MSVPLPFMNPVSGKRMKRRIVIIIIMIVIVIAVIITRRRRRRRKRRIKGRTTASGRTGIYSVPIEKYSTIDGIVWIALISICKIIISSINLLLYYLLYYIL